MTTEKMEYTYDLAPKLKSLDEFLSDPNHPKITSKKAKQKLEDTRSSHEFFVQKGSLQYDAADIAVAFINPYDHPLSVHLTMHASNTFMQTYEERIEIAPGSVGYPFGKKYVIPLMSTIYFQKSCQSIYNGCLKESYVVYCHLNTDERRALMSAQHIFNLGKERYAVGGGMFGKE